MKKIPTMFERNWAGDKSRVTQQIHPGCEWVLAGEGVATRKLDGTSCLVRDGRLFKRRELRPGDAEPDGFELSDFDAETGKRIGWLPVGAGPDDQWHRAAFAENLALQDGAYELVGPKIQGNPEKEARHILVSHAELNLVMGPTPRTFEGIRDYLTPLYIEGIVFHHPDGRMAKIKKKDFGLKR